MKFLIRISLGGLVVALFFAVKVPAANAKTFSVIQNLGCQPPLGCELITFDYDITLDKSTTYATGDVITATGGVTSAACSNRDPYISSYIHGTNKRDGVTRSLLDEPVASVSWDPDAGESGAFVVDNGSNVGSVGSAQFNAGPTPINSQIDFSGSVYVGAYRNEFGIPMVSNKRYTEFPIGSLPYTVVVPAVNGSCGNAAGTYQGDPTGNYPYDRTSYSPYVQCASGSPSTTSFPPLGGSVTWTCSGTNGGSPSPTCYASRSPAPLNGACSNPAVHYVCSPGTAVTQQDNTTSWTWTCQGANNGSSPSCTETQTWTKYCTGANDTNGNNWQLWAYNNYYPGPNTGWISKLNDPTRWALIGGSDPACTPPAAQSDLTVTNLPLLSPGTPTTANVITLVGNIQNIGQASTGGSFRNAFVVRKGSNGGNGPVDDVQGGTVTLGAMSAGGSAPVSVTIPANTYTAGTYSVALCADFPNWSGYWAGVINESNENNNCNGWTNFAVASPPTVTCGPNAGGPSATTRTNTAADGTQWPSLTSTAFCSTGYAQKQGDCQGGYNCWDDAAGGDVYCSHYSNTSSPSCSEVGGTWSPTTYVNITPIFPVPESSASWFCGYHGAITCTATRAAAVNLPQPDAHIYADPTRVPKTGESTITWDASHVATSCTISGPGLATRTTAGPTIAGSGLATNIIARSVYTINCDSGAAKASVTVNILPAFKEF